MATTKRTAVIEIQVDDKSLSQLNAEINELESSMQDLKVGTEEWIAANSRLGELKRNFSEVTAEAGKLQGQVEKIGTDQQIRSVSELGKSMVGAFAGVTGVMSLLGATGNKTLDELTARGVQLLQVMTGLDAISKLFEKNTIDGLKAVGQGFGKVLRQVRTASTGMKAALISTGVGALAVAVGLLIANWDKFINLLRRTEKKTAEALKDAVTQQELRLKTAQGELAVAEERIKIAENEAEYTGDLVQLNKDILEVEKLRFDANRENLKLLDSQIDALNNERKTAKEDRVNEIDAQLQQLKNQKQILLTQQSSLAISSRYTKQNVIIAEVQQKVTNAIKASEDRLIRLNSQLYSTNEIYKEQLNIINLQIGELRELEDRGVRLTKEQRERLNTLYAERDALNETNKQFNEDLQLQKESLEIQRARLQEMGEYNQHQINLNDALREQQRIDRQRQSVLENNQRLIDLDLKGLKEARDLRDSIANFDLQRNKIIKERTEELIPSELRITKEVFDEIQRFLSVYGSDKEYESFDVFTSALNRLINVNLYGLEEGNKLFEEQLKLSGIQLTENEKNLILNFKVNDSLIEQLGITKDFNELSQRNRQLIQDSAEDLALRQIEEDLIVRSLTQQKDALQTMIDLYSDNVQQYNVTTSILEEQRGLIEAQIGDFETQKKNLEDNGGSLEAINVITENIVALENEWYSVNAEINEVLEACKSVEDTIFEIKEDVLEIDLKIKNEEEATNNLLRRRVFELKDLLRVYKQVQDFIEKYNQELSASRDLILALSDLGSSIAERNAEMTQRRIDAISKQIDLLNQKEELHRENLLRYEKELQDANGERFNELLAFMNDEQKLADQAAKEKLNAEKELEKQEKKRLEFERKAAIWRKAQAITDSIIQTILATIESLPNLVLSAIVGATGAIGTASIIAQPLPPKPVGARGGLVRGSSHNQGGVDAELEDSEFVVNKYATAKYYPIIKAMNDEGRRRMAEGGMIGDNKPDLNTSDVQFINYDLLSKKIAQAVSHLPSPSVNILKVDSELNNVRITKQKSGLRR